MPPARGALTGAQSVQRRTATSRGASTANRPPLEPQPAPAWIGGVLAALQAVLWSYLLVVVPAVAGFVSGAASVTTNATWRSAVGVGTKIWLLGHGVPLDAAGVAVSIVPLGVTAVAVVCCLVSARRTARPLPAAWGAFLATYTVVTLLITVAAGGAWARGLLGGALVALVGVTWATTRGPRGKAMRDWWSTWGARVPSVLRPSLAVRDGARSGGALVGLLVVVASLLVVVWGFAGRSSSEDIVGSLGLDLTSGIVLALGQATLVPNLVMWALAWISGAGFVVGTGTSFAPGEAVMGPIPALPMLGGLPTGDMAGSAGRWAPAVVVVLTGWLAVVLWRRLEARTDREVRFVDTIGAWSGLVVTTMLLAWLGSALSAGAAGPGRLTQVGADGIAVAGRLGLLSGVTCLLVLLAAHPAPRRLARRAARRAWRTVVPSRERP